MWDNNVSNLTCYDLKNFQFGTQEIRVNMSQVIQGYNEQFIEKLWYIGGFYFLFVVLMLWLIETHFDFLNKFDPNYRVLKFFLYLNLVMALYLPVLLIGLETGWYQ